MQFGGAHLSEPVRVSKSTSKRANELLYFLRVPLQLTVLHGGRESVTRDPAKPFLGARGLCLPLESGKDLQQKLSYGASQTGRFLDSFTAQSQIFFCVGEAHAAPTMRHGGQFIVCLLLLMAQCVLKGLRYAVSADSSYFIVQRRTPHTPHTRALSCRLDAVLHARLAPAHSLNRDRFRARTRAAVPARDYLLSDNLVEMPSVERPVSFLTCHLPAGPRSGRTVLRLQSIPTSKRTNELLRRRKRGRRGRRRRLGGRRASTSGRASEGQRGRWRGATDRSPVPVPGSQRVVQGSVRRWAAWNAPASNPRAPSTASTRRARSPAERHDTQTLLLAAFLGVCAYLYTLHGHANRNSAGLVGMRYPLP
jgi:hypothetical protein